MVSDFEGLLAVIEQSKLSYDTELIKKAYDLAAESHSGQTRASGEPYLTHPLEAAAILIGLGMDSESIAAALLHDVVEDTEVEIDRIKSDFGADIAQLVDGVTKLGKIPFVSREEQQAENIRKMLIAMAEDVRVIIIKLADRLHNMRTIKSLSLQKQRDKALETMEVYAPIAHRLGIRAIKEELEDLAIAILDPVAYHEIEQALSLRQDERSSFITMIRERIAERIDGVIKNARVEGRVKSIHGIYRKMYVQGRDFDEIYDIYAVRIIVESLIDCYNALGIMHDMFRPIPSRFKDYISTPKPNMYQSLHTTVISKEKTPFEIQIRTAEMHHTAEYGVAAHWKYKLGIGSDKRLEEDRLAWVRRLLDAQTELEDTTDIIKSIKTDLASEEVFVFTPKGDVFSLPVTSTVIDFAYAIHSAVGNRMIGAKVDGRIVPIDYQVKTGEIVEILTTKEAGHGPSRDWLKTVKTSEARNKIRQWFKKERREENVEHGRQEIEREFRRNNIILPENEMREFLEAIAKRQHTNSAEDLFAAIGYGGVALSKIMPRIKEDYLKLVKTQEFRLEDAITKSYKTKADSGGVEIEGVDNCLIKFSRCCNPLPGDDIIGFITRGYGVSIHKRDCTNVPADLSKAGEPERWVYARWHSNINEEFKSTITIESASRHGLLADLTMLLANMHIMIHSVNARETKDDTALITVTVTVDGLEQLNLIITRMKKIDGVISVERTLGS